MESNIKADGMRELTLDEIMAVSGGGGSPVHVPPGAVAPGVLTNKLLENPNGPAVPILF
jgi:hypothetical protein